ncbi:hypothetical protein GCM10028814_16330 [Angustibacter aerolatus]
MAVGDGPQVVVAGLEVGEAVGDAVGAVAVAVGAVDVGEPVADGVALGVAVPVAVGPAVACDVGPAVVLAAAGPADSRPSASDPARAAPTAARRWRWSGRVTGLIWSVVAAGRCEGITGPIGTFDLHRNPGSALLAALEPDSRATAR